MNFNLNPEKRMSKEDFTKMFLTVQSLVNEDKSKGKKSKEIDYEKYTKLAKKRDYERIFNSMSKVSTKVSSEKKSTEILNNLKNNIVIEETEVKNISKDIKKVINFKDELIENTTYVIDFIEKELEEGINQIGFCSKTYEINPKDVKNVKKKRVKKEKSLSSEETIQISFM